MKVRKITMKVRNKPRMSELNQFDLISIKKLPQKKASAQNMMYKPKIGASCYEKETAFSWYHHI
jgi:hypothetical protein